MQFCDKISSNCTNDLFETKWIQDFLVMLIIIVIFILLLVLQVISLFQVLKVQDKIQSYFERTSSVYVFYFAYVYFIGELSITMFFDDILKIILNIRCRI